MNRRQHGLTTVEFSLIAVVTMMMLFAVIEFGRVFYSFSVLNEGMRRAARLAAVCPIYSPEIWNSATLNGQAGLPNFNPFTNVFVEYLDQSGNMVLDPFGSFGTINYVRVQVINYRLRLSIPFLNVRIRSPSFAVTLPRESLGVTPTNYSFCGFP
jgi:TadE-like protein